MADINTYPIVRHLQAGPTSHIRRMKKGRLVTDGVGQSFWFRPLGAAISEVPTEELENSMLFRARTADFQEVSVQATITFRIADPGLAAARIDFSIDPKTGMWREMPMDQLGNMLSEMAQQHAVGLLAMSSLEQIMTSGIPIVRDGISEGMANDPWLVDAGVAIVSVRVIAIRPDGDIENALQNPVRERLQQEADKATFERRARAVEQERAIGENELKNRIELARREEQLVAQQGANERLGATEQAEADRIRNESEATSLERKGLAQAERQRALGSAEAETDRAKAETYAQLGEATIMALALRELAQNLPDVDTLVLTPELLTPLIQKLSTPSTAAALEPADR